jgi:hypothetical protein
MKTSILFLGAAISALAMVAGCATHPDGRRMTMAEQWQRMVDNQDAAARNFVDTERDTADSKPPKASEPPVRATPPPDSTMLR